LSFALESTLKKELVIENVSYLLDCAQKIYKIIKINKTQILLKYLFGARGVKFLEKRRENVQIFQALR
jgi:hypothetical protein